MSSKPSSEFQNLLEGLLSKDVSQRMGWSELVVHAFWQGSLQHLAQELEMPTSMRESLRQSAANFTSTVIADSRPMTAVVDSMSASDHTDATPASATDDARPGSSTSSYVLLLV